MDSENHSPRPSKKEAESTEANDDVIYDAVPLSYKLPDNPTIFPMRANMQYSPRPSKEVETNSIGATPAIPSSYRLPDDPAVTQVRKNMTGITPMDPMTSSVENVGQSKMCQWRDHWIVQPRQRSNGKYDKYYYHKKTKLMCRSLVEVDNFELNGILPPHARRGRNKKSSTAKESMTSTNHVYKEEPDHDQQLLEKFYNDAYNNLHNRSTPNMNESTEGNNEKRNVEESSKQREEDSAAGLANQNNNSV